MRRILPLLLFAVVAFAGCQSAKAPEEYAVKDADFGTWAEFVARWDGDMPGITGIGKPDQPDSEWLLHRPVWHADFSAYVVDFGYGTILKAFVKNDHVVRFFLAYAGSDPLGFQRFSQGAGKAIVVAGVTAHWNEPAVLRVAEGINKAGPQSRTIVEGDYALNLVRDQENNNTILSVGRK